MVTGNAPAQAPLGAAPFESDFSARAGVPLQLFGRDAFSEAAPQSPAAGAIKDDYHLGIGDEIDVELRGPASRSLVGRVGRDGNLLLPGLPPVPAVDQSFGAFRTTMVDTVHRTLGNMDVFVSLTTVHEISVLVGGAVRAPGIRRLDPFATVINALSGELAADASLRTIELSHQGVTRTLDLYPLLLGGRPPEGLALTDGDRIFVPTVRNLVAIAGEVVRPAIYEVPPGGIAASGLIDLAGGYVRPSGNRLILRSLDRAGVDHGQELSRPATTRLKPSDVLLIERSESLQVGEVSLEGNVRVPGPRALSAAGTLSALLPADQLKMDPYLPFIVRISADPATLTRRISGADFGDIQDHQDDLGLATADTVIVLGRDDIAYLGAPEVQNILRRNSAVAAGYPALDRLATVVAQDQGGRFSSAIRPLAFESSAATPCPAIFAKYPDLLPYLLEHAISVDGEVRRPGVYPVARGTNLAEIVAVAGGVTATADLRNIELTRFEIDRPTGRADFRREELALAEADFSQVKLEAGDAVRFNPVFNQRDLGPVTLAGEFRRPGLYDIERGEKLSSLYARAGGLTDAAFPYGAVLTRVSVQKLEEVGRERLIRDLQIELSRVSAGSGPAAAADVASAAQQALVSLQTTPSLGRMVFEADAAMLELHPELDIVLEPGDRIEMPKRPAAVTIIGDVLNPSSQQFRDALPLDTYIDHAGGYLSTADTDRVFVILPNGQSERAGSSFWHSATVVIPPGSTIVVPRALSGDTLDIVRDIATALGQTALTAASVAVISR